MLKISRLGCGCLYPQAVQVEGRGYDELTGGLVGKFTERDNRLFQSAASRGKNPGRYILANCAVAQGNSTGVPRPRASNHLRESVMEMRKSTVVFLCLMVACFLSMAQPGNAAAQSKPEGEAEAGAVEQGKFILHKFEQPIGSETYEMLNSGDSLAVKMEFKFTDRGQDVPLSASFRGTSDLTPQAFEIKGKTARPVSIDESATIESGKLHLRTRDKQTEAALPSGPFFTIAGYAPTTMQMLMVRYWAAHGSPAELPTLPTGSVKIEPRGKDSVHVGDKDEQLDRYTIEGLIWGRETLWFDAQRNLIAAITTDAEFDHFEAIREGYENLLGDLVGKAGRDGMAALAEVSKGISGSRSTNLAIVGATLIDGTGTAPISDSAVVIQKGRIVAAGPRNKVRIPRHSHIVKGSGKTILPGL